MNTARLEAMLIAILTDIKMNRPESQLDALILELWQMGEKQANPSDEQASAVGIELKEVSRFLSKDAG